MKSCISVLNSLLYFKCKLCFPSGQITFCEFLMFSARWWTCSSATITSFIPWITRVSAEMLARSPTQMSPPLSEK